MTTALLLVQLGSPASIDVNDIKAYLGQFLGDWHTTGKKSLFWKLLLKFVILPRGKYTSQAKYIKMYNRYHLTEMPLVKHSRQFLEAVQAEYKAFASSEQHNDTSYADIQLAFQYGCKPSTADILKEFEQKGIDTVHVLPLYPQRSEVITQAAIDNVLDSAKRINFKGKILSTSGFYRNEAWVNEVAASINEQIEKDDALIVSCHAIQSWRVEKKHDPYRDDCELTRKLLSAKLHELAGDRFSGETYLVYQSKFKPGKLPSGKWLSPTLAETAQKLGAQGKSIVIVCPVFTADNLETLHEIDDDVASIYYNAGGTKLKRISCLNARPSWARAFVREILPSLDFKP